MDPYFQQIFSLGMGISSPCVIKAIDLVPSEKRPSEIEMHISIDFEQGAKFVIRSHVSYMRQRRNLEASQLFSVSERIPKFPLNF